MKIIADKLEVIEEHGYGEILIKVHEGKMKGLDATIKEQF